VVARSVHDISHRLHPAKLRLIGLVPAINGLFRELSSLDPSIAMTFTHEHLPDISPDLALCMFRIAQEALQNAIKHSHAETIALHLSARPGALAMRIVDDGIGFDVHAVDVQGIGLISIRERLEAFCGALTIESGPRTGTRLEVVVPLDAAHFTTHVAS
jgi:signal transduction histidine kinase